MWLPGAPVTITAGGTAQKLTTSVGLCKAIRFEQHWNNTHRIYWGDSTLNVATPTGLLGWLPPPVAGNPPPAEVMSEPDAPNGINAGQVWTDGTTGEIVLWSYLVQ
jgi:hypothetical protein